MTRLIRPCHPTETICSNVASSSRLATKRRVTPLQIRRAQTTGAQLELELDLESESEVPGQPIQSVVSVDERLLSLSGTAKEDVTHAAPRTKRVRYAY